MKKLKYIPLILLSLTPILWFIGKPDILVNGIDTNFPLNPLNWIQRRFFVWSSVPNAGVDFSSSTAGLFFHAIQTIPYIIGLKLQIVEIISFITWFGLIVLGSSLLARKLFSKNSIVQLLFVVLYAFNIYMFNSWENVKVANLSLVAGIPYAIYLLVSLKNKEMSRPKAALISCVIGIILSGSGINPAYFAAFFSIMFIFFITSLICSGGREVRKTIIDFCLVSFFIILINSFWLFPTLNFIRNNITPQGSIQNIGFTNWVDSLSENTSIANILRLLGAWDWYAFDSTTNTPLYIPYATRFFYHPVFIAFSALIPALAFISFIVRKKEHNFLYLFWGILLLTGIFFGVGTHSPTGGLFRFLSLHLPFFSLFRSPWYIFTPMLTLAYAGLVSLLFFNLGNFFNRHSSPILKKGIFLVATGIIVGNLIYSYPLILGRVFRPGRPDGFFIKFPDYVFSASKWLESAKDGRVISYPDDEIENFQWQYRGIESVLALASNREILYPPLNAANEGIALLIKQFYSKLKKSEITSANNLAAKLNVRYLFEKLDQNTLAAPLQNRLSKDNLTEFVNWQFNEISSEYYLPKISTSSKFLFANQYNQGAELLDVLTRDSHIVNPKDNVVAKIPEITRTAGEISLAKNSQIEDFKDVAYGPSTLSNRLLNRDPSVVTFSFEIRQSGKFSPTLERYKLEEFGIYPTNSLQVVMDGDAQTWNPENVTDSFVQYSGIQLTVGKHTVKINLKVNSLISGGDFEKDVEFEETVPNGGNARYEIISENGNKFLSIHNIGKFDVTADFKIPKFDPLGQYFIQFKYKQVYGNNGLIICGQNTNATVVKTQVEKLPNYPEWQNFSFFYDPVKTNSELKVLLSSPSTKDPLGTKILYDDLVIYRVFTNSLVLVKDPIQEAANPEVDFQAISPTEYRVKVKNAVGSHALIFLENFSNQWELRVTGVKPLHFSTDSYANAWYINKTGDYEATIYYRAQDIYKLGAILSLTTFVLATGLYLKQRFKR